MNITMEQKIRKFFDTEYRSAIRYIDYLKLEPCFTKVVVDKTICRILGVTQFVQDLGVEYKEITPIYDEYKEKLEKLLIESEVI